MYSVLNIDCKHATSSSGWVNAIGIEERGAVPKEIKIVNEVKTQSAAGRFETGVQQEQPGKARISATKYGNGTRNTNGLSTSA